MIIISPLTFTSPDPQIGMLVTLRRLLAFLHSLICRQMNFQSRLWRRRSHKLGPYIITKNWTWRLSQLFVHFLLPSLPLSLDSFLKPTDSESPVVYPTDLDFVNTPVILMPSAQHWFCERLRGFTTFLCRLLSNHR